MAKHHARIVQLLNVARSLKELVNIEDPEDRYREALDVIVKLQIDVQWSLRTLLKFKEKWTLYESLKNRMENWLTRVEKEMHDPEYYLSVDHLHEFWVRISKRVNTSISAFLFAISCFNIIII